MVLLWSWLGALDNEMKLVIASDELVGHGSGGNVELVRGPIGELEVNPIHLNSLASDGDVLMSAVVGGRVVGVIGEVGHCFQSLLCLLLLLSNILL